MFSFSLVRSSNEFEKGKNLVGKCMQTKGRGRTLEKTNKVCCLKLIWRLLLSGDSLWVRWVHQYLIRKGSFWTANDKSSLGSWIWKKILKYRNLAFSLTRIEVRSGATTSFWYDQWSQLGRIIDITGARGSIDLGIPMTATVEYAVQVYRSRRHRVGSLIDIENEILKIRMQGLSTENDSRLYGRGMEIHLSQDSVRGRLGS